MTETEKQLEALKKLRTPFDASLISKLPKPTKAQTDEVKKNFKSGIRCKICGGWHHPNVVHLDYVGHAALTSRLLDVDPFWNWEPVSTDENFSPLLDEHSGMWIRLTVCNVTRYGYGSADGKTGPNAIKEVIGDGLRNAAMRFGCALDLWSKADLTKIQDDTETDSNVIDAAYWQDKLDKEAKKDLGGIKTWKAKNIDQINKMADGREKADALAYIEDMIKEYTPAKQERKNEAKQENRDFVDKCLAYLKSPAVSSSLDTFVTAWDAYIAPDISWLSADQQKELTDLKSQTETKFQGAK